jgi:MFS family permease
LCVSLPRLRAAHAPSERLHHSGFDTGVVSGALLVIGTALGGARLTTGQEEFLVSSALLGALVGSLAAGRMADGIGRKPVIVTSAVLFALGGEFTGVAAEDARSLTVAC